MSTRGVVLLLTLAALVVTLGAGKLVSLDLFGPDQIVPPPSNRSPRDSFFLDRRVHRIDFSISKAGLSELSDSPKEYIEAAMTIDGKTYKPIKIKMKGNRSFQNWEGKPSFRIKLSKKALPEGFFGLHSIVLNNMVEDPTLLREHLAYDLFRSYGIPAPRTAYTNVFVNGELYGLHLLLEPLDESMLEQYLGDGSGPLYEGEYGCDLYSDDVFGLQQKVGDDPDRVFLKTLTEALDSNKGSLLTRTAQHLDGERMVMYLALSQFMGDFDGYNHGHNYYLYYTPKSKKWTILPWGQDRVLRDPLRLYDSDGRLARLCFEERECRLAYIRALTDVIKRVKSMELDETARRQYKLIEKSASKDERIPFSPKERKEAYEHLIEFIHERPFEMEKMTSCWNGTEELDRDGDGYGCMDCDDENPKIHPGAPEICNKVDDNCSGLVDDNPECSCNELESEGAHFSLCRLKMTYLDARTYCERRGERLAWVDNKYQARALQKAAVKIRKGDWWIGLDDIEKEGKYQWLAEGTGDIRWSSGEPNVHTCGQDCATINNNEDGRFRDIHCAERIPFICRRLGEPSKQTDDGAGTEEAEDDSSKRPRSSNLDHKR